MKEREITELIDYYSLGLMRMFVSFKPLKWTAKKLINVYNYDKSKK